MDQNAADIDCQSKLKISKKFRAFFHEDYKEFLNVPIIPDVSLYVFPKGKDIQNPDDLIDDLFSELELLLKATSSDSISSVVILGSGGSGKSSMALEFCARIWENHKVWTIENKNRKDGRIKVTIPIYINLPMILRDSSDHNDLLKAYIDKKLSKHCQDQQTAQVLSQLLEYNLLLIFDGFNEVSIPRNLWDLNGWNNYKIKCIYFSRPDAFKSKREMVEIFQCGVVPSRIFYLEPFHIDQVKSYICSFVKYLNQLVNCSEKHLVNRIINSSIWPMTLEYVKGKCWVNNEKEYQKWILDKIPSLCELGKTPFLLLVILQVLPVIVAKAEIDTCADSANFKDKVRRIICRTEVDVFDALVNCWFEFAAARVIKNNLPDNLELVQIGLSDLVKYYEVYSQNLAVYLVERNNGFLTDPLLILEEDDTLQSHLTEPMHYPELWIKRHNEHTGIFPSCIPENKKQEESDNVKEARNKVQMRNLVELRNGCLLKYSQDTSTGKFQFLHHSLVEYFAARDLFQGLRAELNYFLLQDMTECPSKVLKFNTMPIEDFGPPIFHQIVNRVKIDVDFAKCLYEVVESSKTLSILGQMASNAATVLNFAGQSLSGLDWTEVQIPGANLNQANCANTDFSGANLSRVTFHNSFLPYCKFKGTNLNEVSFGQFAPLQLHEGFKASKLIRGIAFYSGNDGHEYIFYCQDLSIYKAKIGSSDLPLSLKNSSVNAHAIETTIGTDYNLDTFFLSFFVISDRVIAKMAELLYNKKGKIWIWCAITGELLNELDPREMEVQVNNRFDILTEFGEKSKLVDKFFKITIWSFEDILIYRNRCICTDKGIGSYHEEFHKYNSEDFDIFPWLSRAHFVSTSYLRNSKELRIISTSPQGKMAVRFKTLVNIFDARRENSTLKLPNLNLQEDAGNIQIAFSSNEVYLAYSDESNYFGLLNFNSAIKVTPIPFKKFAKKSPSFLLFNNNGTKLLASFRNVRTLTILDIPSCQALNEINQYNNPDLNHYILPNFCFCNGDEFVAFVSGSAKGKELAQGYGVTITKLVQGVTENRRNKQSWMVKMTVSHDSKYIAFSMEHDFNHLSRSNLEIHSIPMIPHQSLISEAQVKQIMQNSPSFDLSFSKGAIPRLLIFFSRGFLVVLNINCDILTTVDLIDANPSPLEVKELIHVKHNWRSDESRSIKFLEIDFWLSNTTDEFTMHWENKIWKTNYEILDESPFIKFEKGELQTNFHRSDCCNMSTFVVWSNYIICHKIDRSGFLILHVPTKILKQIDLELGLDEIGKYTIFDDDEDSNFVICWVSNSGRLHFISICPTVTANDINITFQKRNDSFKIDSKPCSYLYKPASQPVLFVIYRDGKIECRNLTDPNTIIFSINLWFAPFCVVTREVESNATALYISSGDGSIICLLLKNSKEWTTEWFSQPCEKLIASQCHLGNSYELDLCSQVLLKGLQAQGKPFPRLEDAKSRRTDIRYISLAELLKGFPNEERAESMIPIIAACLRNKKINDNADNMQMISSNQWSVSCVVRKQRWKKVLKFPNMAFPHMALILEGILHYMRFGVRFDLIYDQLQTGTDREVCILAKRENSKSLRKISINKHYRIKQFFITSESGWKLLQEIRQDMHDPIGRNISEYNIRNKNCKSWVREKLRSIGIELEKHWFDKFVDFPH